MSYFAIMRMRIETNWVWEKGRERQGESEIG